LKILNILPFLKIRSKIFLKKKKEKKL